MDHICKSHSYIYECDHLQRQDVVGIDIPINEEGSGPIGAQFMLALINANSEQSCCLFGPMD